MNIQSLVVTVTRWPARALALATFAFWGWLFAAQLDVWVVQPWPLAPPLGVWVAKTLYVLLLAGLLIGLRWELAGGLLVVGAAIPFFAAIVPQFIPLAILPGMLYIACGLSQTWLDRQTVIDEIDEPIQSVLDAA